MKYNNTCCPIGTTGRKKVQYMKYYVFYRKKNHIKETGYVGNVSNLIRIKLDIESLYRWCDMKSDIDDIVEWRIYDENTKLLEIGVVESTVKGKEVSWYVGV